MSDINAKQLLQIQEFMNKQSTGLNTVVSNEAEVKEIRKQFKNTQSLITQFVEDKNATNKEKEEQLIAVFETLTQYSQKYEECLNLLKHNNSIIKQDTELTQQETSRVSQLKDKYSKICLEIGDAIKQIKSTNKLMVESESTQRQQLIDNFENSLKDITSKIDEQDKEREEKEKENNLLKEELKKQLSEYEEKEKTYLSGLEEKDGEFKGKVEEFLNQIKSVESEAQEAIKLRQELNLMAQNETEKKLKIAIYQKRMGELVDSIDRTNSTLCQLKESLLKMYWKQHKLQQQQAQLNAQYKKGEAALLVMMQKNNEVESDIAKIKAQKDILKQKVLDTQAKIKAIK